MDITSSALGVTYKERVAVIATATPTEIIEGAVPQSNAEGIEILFSMDDVTAWATGTLEILNNGRRVWLFEDQFLTLLEPFFLMREVRMGDNYSAVLTQGSGGNVACAIQMTMGVRVPVAL